MDCVEGMFSDGEVIPFSHENFDRLAKVPQIKATHRRVASKRFISAVGLTFPTKRYGQSHRLMPAAITTTKLDQSQMSSSLLFQPCKVPANPEGLIGPRGSFP